ncbi:hypothetical protein LCGC14_1890070 [marine sediment metagenome]|uniref:Uncharacterized protein n=1 Tax=marine sediment metagenome TaxID=412755 RepID=A0A0F9IDN0_9ZZZZ
MKTLGRVGLQLRKEDKFMIWRKRRKVERPPRPKVYYLACPLELDGKWPQLLEAEGLDVAPGPSALEEYLQTIANGAYEKLDLPRPTEEEIAQKTEEDFQPRTNIICRSGSAVVTVCGTSNDESGMHEIRMFTDLRDSPREERLALVLRIEEILICHGATIVDELEEDRKEYEKEKALEEKQQSGNAGGTVS